MHIFQMKFASVVKTGVLAVFAAGLLVSCSKENINGGVKPVKSEITDKGTRDAMKEMADKLPAIGIYNHTMDKVIVFDHKDPHAKNFTFVNPGPGFNYASSNGGQWVYTDQGEFYVITEPSAGLGSGGGTVVCGNTSLDIDIAFCFSYDEEATGLDLFDFGDISDVAGVVGIAGDFEALMSEDFSEEDADPFDYFEGFAYYLVYAENLQNDSYEVLNWFEDLDQDPEELDGFGFAFVIAFQQEGIYMSSEGDLTVNGASIGFNGSYFGIEDFFGFYEGEDDEPSFVEVPGFGTMGCE